MRLTVSEAAKAAGVARSTLYRAIEAGELSRSTDKKIDTSELLRVYGELHVVEEGEDTASSKSVPVESGTHAAWLQDLVETQNATIARLHEQIERQTEDLREADARAERKEQAWMRQLDKITALLPSPEPVPETPKPEPVRKRFLGIF